MVITRDNMMVTPTVHNPHIVPGCDICATQPVGPLLKYAELHRRIAVNTGIGRIACKITVDERPHHKFLELLAHIGHVVADAKTRGKCRRRLHSAKPGITGNESKTLDPVTLLKQHTAHSRAVNATAHSHKNTPVTAHKIKKPFLSVKKNT